MTIENGFSRINILGNVFEITNRYHKPIPIGMGAFGLVCSAIDQVTGGYVAVKKIVRPFQQPIMAKRTYRELKLLKHLKHENIIQLIDMYLLPFMDIYIVTELQETDLQKLLGMQKLEQQVVEYFTYQMLRGLKYVHSGGVIHRDLKPSNILINKNCELKICDFGLARSQEKQMTGYVLTRYYRAPEIMLTWQRYDTGVDIWSVGCILAEMIEGTPLFPGKDHVNQFDIITDLLGSPSSALLEQICSENTLRFVKSLPHRAPFLFEKRFAHCTHVGPNLIDLLSKMLVFDPKDRISAFDALEHVYLSKYHDPNDEPVCEKKFDWDFYDANLSTEIWRQRIYSEILDFHNPNNPTDINT